MIDMANIHPLTDFKRNTSEFRARLRKTGQPAVLTVEGRPELVVQDAAAYQRLLERADAIAGIRRGLEDVRAGRTHSAQAMLAAVRRELKLPRKRRA